LEEKVPDIGKVDREKTRMSAKGFQTLEKQIPSIGKFDRGWTRIISEVGK
jgi:hypothetical protein